MINTQELYEWRWKDESNGLVLPYYTRPALDWLQGLNMRDKRVFEYGLGASTLWYEAKEARVFGVDNNPGWYTSVKDQVGPNTGRLLLRTMPNDYVKAIYQFPGVRFDVVVIDGDNRDDCVGPALERLTEDGLLIIDNWAQPSVYMPTEATKSLLKNIYCTIYKQPGHPDWQTAVFDKFIGDNKLG